MSGATAETAVRRFVERCPACPGIIPSTGPRACDRCGRVRVTPRHQEWPLHLKGYLIFQAALRHFIPGISVQSVWEKLLTATIAGTQRDGQMYRHAVPADDVYGIVLKDADKWLADGKPISILNDRFDS